MKKHTLFLTMSLLALFMGNVCFAQNSSKALEYMNVIGLEYQNISKNSWDYITAVAHGKSAKKIDKRRSELISATSAAKSRVSKLKPFEGDASYRDSVISYLELSYYVMKNDYEKIVNMEEISEQSYDLMEAYITARQMANQKVEKANEMVIIEQKKFADKYNIKLIEEKSKLGANLDKAGEVFEHHNTVYLIFFKVYKQEAYLLDAMQKGDVNAMVQNNNSIPQLVDEALQKLTTVSAYKGDNSVITACIQMMEFYKMEAKSSMPTLIEFYLTKERYEKVKNAFDAKSQSDRTQSDVDEYNKAVNEYNNKVTEFNKINQDLNTKRSTLLDKWNNAGDNFLNKHVPKK